MNLYKSLINLDVPVDPPHERVAREPPNRAAHHPQRYTEHRGVPEVKAGLEQPGHFRFEDEVVHGVEVDLWVAPKKCQSVVTRVT